MGFGANIGKKKWLTIENDYQQVYNTYVDKNYLLLIVLKPTF